MDELELNSSDNLTPDEPTVDPIDARPEEDVTADAPAEDDAPAAEDEPISDSNSTPSAAEEAAAFFGLTNLAPKAEPEPFDLPIDLTSTSSDEAEDEVEAEDEEEEDDEPEPVHEAIAVQPEDNPDGPHWYFVHCYSGQENKVRQNLEQRIATMGMKGKILDVIVPTEEEIEVKDGKRRTVERRVFPGYILVNMAMSEETWYVVRNTPGVTGFVGMGNTPTPLRPEEVAGIIKRMEAEAPKVKVTFKTGQKVRIIDGPFNDFIGTVSEIDMDRTKVRVMVSFFGRETPVELDFLQVEKV